MHIITVALGAKESNKAHAFQSYSQKIGVYQSIIAHKTIKMTYGPF
jgi:hypothetical protein